MSKEDKNNDDKYAHIQFYIGQNMIFCSERDLKPYLSPADIKAILNVILAKLV